MPGNVRTGRSAMVAESPDSGQTFLGGSGVLEKLYPESRPFDPTHAGQSDRDGVLATLAFDLEREVGSDDGNDLTSNGAAWAGQIDKPAFSGNIVSAESNGIPQRHPVMRSGAHSVSFELMPQKPASEDWAKMILTKCSR